MQSIDIVISNLNFRSNDYWDEQNKITYTYFIWNVDLSDHMLSSKWKIQIIRIIAKLYHSNERYLFYILAFGKIFITAILSKILSKILAENCWSV